MQHNSTQNIAWFPFVCRDLLSQYMSAMQGIMYTQPEPSHVNGASFPSLYLYTITNQYICEVQTTLEMTQSTSIYGKQGSVDPSPPYTE